MIQWSSPKPQNGDWHIGRGVAIIMQKSGIPDIDQANCMIKLESDAPLSFILAVRILVLVWIL